MVVQLNEKKQVPENSFNDCEYTKTKDTKTAYLKVGAAASTHEQRIAGENTRQIVQQIRHTALQYKKEMISHTRKNKKQ